jgi:hypothetical protein
MDDYICGFGCVVYCPAILGLSLLECVALGAVICSIPRANFELHARIFRQDAIGTEPKGCQTVPVAPLVVLFAAAFAAHFRRLPSTRPKYFVGYLTRGDGSCMW